MHSYSITTIATLLSGASAHIFMKTPVPFGHNADGGPLRIAPYILPNELNSSPLGTDTKSGTVQHFPCQFGPDFKYSMSDAPKVAAGSSTLLTFQGSAVHGGGSCQVSLAKTASKDPKDWHVIHSIIGGCPGTNAPGTGEHAGAGGMDNFTPSPNAGKPDAVQCTGIDTDELTCLKKFNIPIPKDVASGQYFLAWTWFNKVGNREMYMNCSPLEITGGGTSEEWLNKQPSIFYANHLEGNTCKTLEGKSLNFTQPGDSVIYSQNPFDHIEASTEQGTGAACAALYPPQSSKPAHVAFLKLAADGSGSPPAASTGSLATATSIVGTTTVTASAPPTNAPVSVAPNPVASIPAASSIAAAPLASSAPAAPVASINPSIPAANCAHPCPEDGKMVCFSAVSFGMCNNGCAVPQDVAPGTICQNGAIGVGGRSGKRAIVEKSRVMRPRRAPLRKSEWTV